MGGLASWTTPVLVTATTGECLRATGTATEGSTRRADIRRTIGRGRGRLTGTDLSAKIGIDRGRLDPALVISTVY